MARYPDELDREVILRDGARLRIRPILPEDETRLGTLYGRLSRRTAYQRFFTVMTRLPPDWAHDFAHVDYRRRLALVAERDPDRRPELIGVARYDAFEAEEDAAEIAIVVQDYWQDKGLGRALLEDLLRAAEANGIHRFAAYVLPDNHRALSLLARMADIQERRTEDGVTTVRFTRRGTPPSPRLRGLAELGFDVEEVELIASEGGYRLRFNPQVVEPGHHSRRRMRLTGIDAQENRARRLLHDIAGFRAQPGNGLPLQESAIAARWLAEVYEPALAAIPAELRGKLQPAEAFHQILTRDSSGQGASSTTFSRPPPRCRRSGSATRRRRRRTRRTVSREAAKAAAWWRRRPVASAVQDALRPLGVEVAELPVTPDRIVRWVREARARW